MVISRENGITWGSFILNCEGKQENLRVKLSLERENIPISALMETLLNCMFCFCSF
jgi:hypothetical protein